MGKHAIPDRWVQYNPIGKRIEGTRFISFKVPLRKEVNGMVSEPSRLDPDMLMSKIPNLGLIIDLTATKRYYDPQVFTNAGLQYAKLEIPGRKLPKPNFVAKFKVIVMAYLKENLDNDTLIGVHCTHGLNRTGFFICNYMITELNMRLDEALDKFQNARGHKIERMNYVESLRQSDLRKSINRHKQETKRPMPQTSSNRIDGAGFETTYEDERRTEQIYKKKSKSASDTTWQSYGNNRRGHLMAEKSSHPSQGTARRSNRDNRLPQSSSYRTDDTAYRSNSNTRKTSEGFELGYNNLPKSNRQQFWSPRSKFDDFELTNWRLRPAESEPSQRSKRSETATRPKSNWRERY